MSGKKARELRKKSLFSKKVVATCAGLCLSAVPLTAGGEFLISVFPHLSYDYSHNKTAFPVEYGVGAGLRLTYRANTYLDFYAQGDYINLPMNTKEDIGSANLFGGSLGAGYHLPLTDRLSLNMDIGVGASAYKIGDSRKGGPLINFGGGIGISYLVHPAISVDAKASANHFGPGIVSDIAFTPGLTVNLSRLFNKTTNMDMQVNAVAPVFPVFYSWYKENPFAAVTITNLEDAAINNVKVSFYQPQYMNQANECATIKNLAKGESVDVELTAFFNEQMLSLSDRIDTQTSVIVEYSYLGQKKTKTFPLVMAVYGRNNMSWADDRRAAAFVSSKDPAALYFGRYVTSVIRNNLRVGVPANIQYAMGVFETLDQFGLQYVKDPSSSYQDNVGSESIDFLQFPYQTLKYRGGDCDDISILVCSLFEAVGIRTAFITIPGHIYMAFDSGLTVAEAEEQFSSMNDFIIVDNQVWVPLEITLTDEGFNKAWKYGAREWRNAEAKGAAALYKMADSWQIYSPVSVPGAEIEENLPSERYITRLFDHAVDTWITNEIQAQVENFNTKLAIEDDVKLRNDFGVLYGRYGLYAKADEQLKKARRQGYEPALINTGNLYFAKQDYDRAIKWYDEVLAENPNNVLAVLGLARCAYEKSDFNACDKYYSQVSLMNPELAARYGYLGSFESTEGRSFNLTDRLSNTVWCYSEDSLTPVKPVAVVKADEVIVPVDPASISIENIVAANQEAEKEPETVITESDPVDTSVTVSFINPEVAIVPSSTSVQEVEEEEEKEAATHNGTEGGNNNGNTDGDNSFAETSEELQLVSASLTSLGDFLRPDDTLMDSSDFDNLLPETLKPAETETNANSISNSGSSSSSIDNTYEVPTEEALQTEHAVLQEFDASILNTNREIPRFTESPSAEWAPEEAFTADFIPGMRSFEEEMGNYNNEKAFLYQEEDSFGSDPDTDDEEETETASGANISVLVVNPFASYLSEEDQKIVEQNTGFTLKPEEPVAEESTENAESAEKSESVIKAASVTEDENAGVSAGISESDNSETETEVESETSETEVEVESETSETEAETENQTQNQTVNNESQKDSENKKAAVKNRKPLYVAFGAVGAVILAVLTFGLIKKRKRD